MEKPLTGKVALVTGGSRGIGAATASVLAQRGFRVVVNYRASAQEAEEVVEAIRAAGGEAVAMQADVTAAGDVTRMVGDIDQRWGSPVKGRSVAFWRVTAYCSGVSSARHSASVLTIFSLLVSIIHFSYCVLIQR